MRCGFRECEAARRIRLYAESRRCLESGVCHRTGTPAMELLLDPTLWIAFAMLTTLEIVLGIDNIIFLTILVGRLPAAQRDTARRAGLAFAMLTRIALLLSLSWVMGLTTELFAVAGQSLSGRDLVLLGGGAVPALQGVARDLRGGGAGRGAARAPAPAGARGALLERDRPDRRRRHRLLARLRHHRGRHGRPRRRDDRRRRGVGRA